MEELDFDAILDLPMEENDSGATTIKGYLIALLREVWKEEEGFSGKRPFGNSGWVWDVYKALVQGSIIGGTINRYEELDDCDDEAGYAIIMEAIGNLL